MTILEIVEIVFAALLGALIVLGILAFVGHLGGL